MKWTALYSIIDSHLGKWTVFLGVIWKFLVEPTFKSWLEIKKDIAIKNSEFEKEKLNRVIPKLQDINNAFLNHQMMFRTYSDAIKNKNGIPKCLEKSRLEQDEIIIEAISNIAIYLPSEFRILLYRIRTIISCSWHDPLVINRVLRDIGNAIEVPSIAMSSYYDLSDCFYSMCSKYIGTSNSKKSYKDILYDHGFDKNAVIRKKDPKRNLAWKFILLHEHYGSNQILEAQDKLEKLYNRKSTIRKVLNFVNRLRGLTEKVFLYDFTLCTGQKSR